LECLYITDFGESEIHIAGFVVGILHYILVPISILLSIHEHSPQYQGSERRIAATLAAYSLSSYYQYRCHYILYQLKRSGKKTTEVSTYSLPREGLFRIVCCPHYMMEIILYIALWQTLPQSLTLLLIVLWTLSNLSVMAYKQYCWYFDNFPNDFIDGDKKYWRILIPGVW
jgi:3-oxo-5-alpha-steroid 4-dehydrogenase 3